MNAHKVVTIDNGNKYYLADVTEQNGNRYFLANKLDDKDNLTDDSSIMIEVKEDGKCYLKLVEDEKIINYLSAVFVTKLGEED